MRGGPFSKESRMFKKNESETVRLRQYKALEKRYERLKEEYDAMKSELTATENELDVCRARLEFVAKAEEEYVDATEQAKRVQAQYEQAYQELKLIRSKYTAEVESLIKQIKY